MPKKKLSQAAPPAVYPIRHRSHQPETPPPGTSMADAREQMIDDAGDQPFIFIEIRDPNNEGTSAILANPRYRVGARAHRFMRWIVQEANRRAAGEELRALRAKVDRGMH